MKSVKQERETLDARIEEVMAKVEEANKEAQAKFDEIKDKSDEVQSKNDELKTEITSKDSIIKTLTKENLTVNQKMTQLMGLLCS